MKKKDYIAGAVVSLATIICIGCYTGSGRQLFPTQPVIESHNTGRSYSTTTTTTDNMALTSFTTLVTSTVSYETVIDYEKDSIARSLSDSPTENNTMEEIAEDDVHSFYEVTEYEKTLMMHTVFHEAGNQSLDCKKAVASVILNRVSIYNKTVTEVIFEPNQFTIDFSCIYYDEDSKTAVNEVLSYGTTIPHDVEFFYADYCWDEFLRSRTVYTQIDDTIFAY